MLRSLRGPLVHATWVGCACGRLPGLAYSSLKIIRCGLAPSGLAAAARPPDKSASASVSASCYDMMAILPRTASVITQDHIACADCPTRAGGMRQPVTRKKRPGARHGFTDTPAAVVVVSADPRWLSRRHEQARTSGHSRRIGGHSRREYRRR